MKVVDQLPNLAFVFLITQAKTDINVALAVLGQVLSLHQGDTQHICPHLVLRLVLRHFGRPLVHHGLVLWRDKDSYKGLLLCSPGTSSCSPGT